MGHTVSIAMIQLCDGSFNVVTDNMKTNRYGCDPIKSQKQTEGWIWPLGQSLLTLQWSYLICDSVVLLLPIHDEVRTEREDVNI